MTLELFHTLTDTTRRRRNDLFSERLTQSGLDVFHLRCRLTIQ